MPTLKIDKSLVAFLISEGAYTQYVRAITQRYPTGSDTTFHTIDESFRWVDTIEGRIFWKALHTKYEKIRKV